MKRISNIIFLSSLILASAFAKADDFQTYSINVGQFDRLKVFNDVNVIYRSVPDSTGMAVFQGGKVMADLFYFTNNDGTLTIQTNTSPADTSPAYTGIPTVYLYSDYLTLVENSSDCDVSLLCTVPVPTFKAKQIGNGKIIAENVNATNVEAALLTGNGQVTITGQCQKATLRMLGTGLIMADRLKAGKVNCKILGSGSIGCWPITVLDVRGIGSTKIYYKGSPEIKKSGGGKLFPIPDDSESDDFPDYRQ